MMIRVGVNAAESEARRRAEFLRSSVSSGVRMVRKMAFVRSDEVAKKVGAELGTKG